MDRTLRNVNAVAAVTSNRDSGYLELSNLQLAEEVQKLNGYNHFSSSAANLLEEVVRRLVKGHLPSIAMNAMDRPANLYGMISPVLPNGMPNPNVTVDPQDQPLFPGSTLTNKDLMDVRAVVILDPKLVGRKNRFLEMSRQLEATKEPATVDDMINEFKGQYNLSEIIRQAPNDQTVLAIYWLKTDPNVKGMTTGLSVHWQWEAKL